jgi:hypothetical protein
MALTITLELSDLDQKCLQYFAADPEEWVRNFVNARIYATKHEIYQAEIRRMTADPLVVAIPADMDTVVSEANIKLASDQPELPPMMPPGM